jgi:hypothetical protein
VFENAAYILLASLSTIQRIQCYYITAQAAAEEMLVRFEVITAMTMKYDVF